MNKITKKNIGYLCVSLLWVLSFIYFWKIGDAVYYSLNNFWARPANIHDHIIYSNYVQYYDTLQLKFLDNSYGISLIYHFLPRGDVQLTSFIVNSIFMVISGYFYIKICDRLNLPASSYYLIMLNTSFLYFALLINKDMMTIALILAATYLGLLRKWVWIVALMIPAFFIRQQLVYFVAVFVALLAFPRFSVLLKTVSVFVATSILGILILRSSDFIALETLGQGITGQITEFFVRNPYLAPLGVPLRIGLYQWEFFSSVLFMEEGQIDAARFLRIPAALYLLSQIPATIKAYIISRKKWDNDLLTVYFAMIAIFAAILLNPQVNGRYFTTIVPSIVLFVSVLKTRADTHRTAQYD